MKRELPEESNEPEQSEAGENPVLGEPELLELTIEPPPPPDIEAAAEEPEPSALADPHNAHSPMSPDDHASDQHPGLHSEEHSTGGPTPAS